MRAYWCSHFDPRFDELVRRVGWTEEFWDLRPTFPKFLGPRSGGDHSRLRRRLQFVARSGFRPHRAVFSTDGRVAGLFGSTNQQRAVVGFLRAHEPPGWRDEAVHLPDPSTRFVAPGRMERAIIRVCRSLDLELDVPFLLTLVAHVRWHHESALAFLEAHGPEALVLANQHAGGHRAVIRACSDLQVPVIYVPHAPLARNPRYDDLPVPYAGLQADNEVAYYRRHGTGSLHDRLVNVGGVMHEQELRWLRPVDESRLLISYPRSSHLQYPFFHALAKEIIESPPSWVHTISLVPHPGDADQAHSWRRPEPDSGVAVAVETGTTAAALRRRTPACVVTGDSGAAIEPLLSGVPSISLVEDAPHYHFQTDGTVPTVSSLEDLRAALEAARRTHRNEDRRRTLQDAASKWVAEVDNEAVRRLVHTATTGAAISPIWDRWREELTPS